MGNVVQFSRVDSRRTVSRKMVSRAQATIPSEYSFEKQVVSEIEELASNLGITFSEALVVAKNFYKKYPMLMEFVRSPEVILDKGDDSARLLSCWEDIKLMNSIDVLNSAPVLPDRDTEGVCGYCGNTGMLDEGGMCEECFLRSIVTLDGEV